MSKYKILVACGYAVTATTIASKLRTALEKKGFNDIEFISMKIPRAIQVFDQIKPDLCVFSGQVDPDTLRECPLFPGVPFLTSIGKDEVLDQIVDVLKKPHWAGVER